MIKVLFGNKGIGKTKYLLEDANSMLDECKGDIVFIDNGKDLMTEIRHEIRYIDISEFPIDGQTALLGFVCGLIAEDYDIEVIYIDNVKMIIASDSNIEEFFKNLKVIADKYDVKFIISISGNAKNIPDFVVKEYTC